MPIEKFFAPTTLAEALDVLDEYGADARVLAGGTYLMPLINESALHAKAVLSLHRAQLDEARAVNAHFAIGATTTLTRLAGIAELSLAAQAASYAASWSVRNLATVGGNLFVPPPYGDVATALLALDAKVIAASKAGERAIPLNEFFRGAQETALKPNELVARLDVPRATGKTAFIKYMPRENNAPAIVTVAVQLSQDGAGVVTEARVALGAANQFPMRTQNAEQALVGQKLDVGTIAEAAEQAKEEAQPFSDALASAWYRRKMVGVYVGRALEGVK